MSRLDRPGRGRLFLYSLEVSAIDIVATVITGPLVEWALLLSLRELDIFIKVFGAGVSETIILFPNLEGYDFFSEEPLIAIDQGVVATLGCVLT
jgi:hypothetical protein